jgi:alanine dehydrogenase
MPAYLEGIYSAGEKIVNIHPKNPSRGLPTVMTPFILNYPETGGTHHYHGDDPTSPS